MAMAMWGMHGSLMHSERERHWPLLMSMCVLMLSMRCDAMQDRSGA